MQNQTQPTSNQDFFNRIWQHFVVEKHPRSILPSGRCVYRTNIQGVENGCAVGCVMSDDLAREADRCTDGAISTVLRQVSQAAEWLQLVDETLMMKAQAIHDNLDIRTMEVRFRQLAEDFKLEIPNAH